MSQLAYEPDPLELFALLPELTLEDVKARLAYARAAIVTSTARLNCACGCLHGAKASG